MRDKSFWDGWHSGKVASDVGSRDQSRPRILIVDDDSSSVDVLAVALKIEGFVTTGAPNGGRATDLLKEQHFDIILLDWRLPDMSPIPIIEAAASRPAPPEVIVVSGLLTVRLSVDLMRIGVIDVLEKPVAIEDLIRSIRRALIEPRLHRRQMLHPVDAVDVDLAVTPRSSAHRWALYVTRHCASERDLRTIEDWAQFLGVSYSTLCESCRIVGVKPHDARDFARGLRAVIMAASRHCHPALLLDVSDRRTLKIFAQRAGETFTQPTGRPSVDRFLTEQAFVSQQSEGLLIVRELLSKRQGAP